MARSVSTIDPSWIAPHRTALLLIDLQVDFASLHGEMARRGADISPAQCALVRAEALLEAARKARVRIAFARLEKSPSSDSKTAQEQKRRTARNDVRELCVVGTRGAEFAGPRPRGDELIVSKHRFSAFVANDLSQRLKQEGRDTLILAGLTTDCCVQASAWDALERDFHVFIARDACAAYEPDLHEQTLKALSLSGAFVEESDSLIRAWQATAQ